ncbi:hypothetical protein SCNRRL3882_3320 [Streptomyces chartreusis NRRL 3882]|uniref:Uncharacterized protein n=1 Tax=Streptomyces chartreusis NRRL 3882 TaxID=1079985 RepID=A0A2N9B945_STRCX|nr:hypothetical protein [Streptomyces chartreusis]SOR79860.1 hypothetical protein SCNRRL3882_3320 [Streptomyces chartreusis NRRL 3882]
MGCRSRSGKRPHRQHDQPFAEFEPVGQREQPGTLRFRHVLPPQGQSGERPHRWQAGHPGLALGHVSPHASWGGQKLWTDHYRDGKDAYNYEDGSLITRKGYDAYNLGKDGYFWRGVARDLEDPDSYDCERVMFWQDAGEIRDVPNAPTPETLAEYAYDRVKVPDTEIELKPEGRSTVNLPTWVWLDKGTKGDADKTPPCGIRYLRATNGEPYQLKASVSWEGTGGANGDLPDGTFETTQDMNVQEIQSINR